MALEVPETNTQRFGGGDDEPMKPVRGGQQRLLNELTTSRFSPARRYSHSAAGFGATEAAVVENRIATPYDWTANADGPLHVVDGASVLGGLAGGDLAVSIAGPGNVASAGGTRCRCAIPRALTRSRSLSVASSEDPRRSTGRTVHDLHDLRLGMRTPADTREAVERVCEQLKHCATSLVIFHPLGVTRQIAHARQYASQKGWAVDEARIYADDGPLRRTMGT